MDVQSAEMAELEVESPTFSLELPLQGPQALEAGAFDHSMLTILKNSTIPVNVDDLGPGLIVVTYIHTNGSLYQGVLLQLNRERGIPCGISFPKDYCSTIPFGINEFDGNENEQPPVQQRHTYFQCPNPHLRPLRRFNRATKPPARYKNGKLALRLRHRPVLCSKCKAYCEEKNPTKPNTKSAENEEFKGGVSTRRNQSKSKTGDQDQPSEFAVAEDKTAKCSSEDLPDEFTFSVAGPLGGLVENYWKRPSPSAPLELLEKATTPHSRKTDEGTANFTTADSTKSFLSLKTLDNNNQSTAAPVVDQSQNKETPPHIQVKKQHLKYCINKLRVQKYSIAQKNHEETSESKQYTGYDGSENDGKDQSVREIFDSPIEQRDTQCELGESVAKVRTKKVPARFREDSCITKNISDFKKKRQVIKSLGVEACGLSPESENPLPQFTTSTCTADDIEGDSLASSDSSSTSRKTSPSKVPQVSLKSEVSRTPTIKISFGSYGKGEVVEIPSKPTLESSPEDLALTIASKAEKRALRKARKEAKRKMSKESVPAKSSLTTNALSISTSNSFEVSSSQSSCSSPPPPLLTPISEFCPPDEEFQTSFEQCPPLIHFTNEIPIPKKRKKEKKHKKDKSRKEEESEVQS